MRMLLPTSKSVRTTVAVLTTAVMLAGTAASPAGAAAYRWVLGRERVRARETDTLTISTRAGRIWVTGDHTTDLDCALYRNGVLLDTDTDNTDVCLLNTDGSGGPYRLYIKNYGDVYNDYVVEGEN